jgi:hypothetical protein
MNFSTKHMPLVIHPSGQNSLPTFIVVGNGFTAPVDDIPPDVTIATKNDPFLNHKGIAYSTSLGILVGCTTVAGKEFLWSEDLGSTWNIVSAPTLKCTRIEWIEYWGRFIAFDEPGNSGGTYIVAQSLDGKVWSNVLDAGHGRLFGIAMQSSVDPNGRMSLAYEGNGNNMFLITGSVADPTHGALAVTTVASGITGGQLNVVWDAVSARYLGFKAGGTTVYQSATGTSGTWTVLTTSGPDVIQGQNAAYAVHDDIDGDKMILFGSTRFAMFSDDGGTSWQDATGFLQTTGSVNRHVAIEGNTIYVAIDGELNTGYLSRDGGISYVKADHASGKPAGVTFAIV